MDSTQQEAGMTDILKEFTPASQSLETIKSSMKVLTLHFNSAGAMGCNSPE